MKEERMKKVGVIGNIVVTYPKISATVGVLALKGVHAVFTNTRDPWFDPVALVTTVALTAAAMSYLLIRHRSWFND